MKNLFKTAAVAALLITTILAAPCRADEVAEKGRQILAAHQKSIVTVQAVIKVSQGGQSRESKQDTTGTVVDPSGLTVLALSSCDPSDLYRRVSENYKMDIEVTDLKMLLDDGTEVPAEIVLRDKDLDLAFIRPKTKPASPMAAVDLAKSATAQALDQVITLNRLGRASGRAYALSVERVSAVIQKPRTFYIPDSNMTSTKSGSPAFGLDGNILGMFVMRSVSSSGGATRDDIISIILPAGDILKGAKQAPEAKGEDEKKDDKKDEKPAKAESPK